LQQHGHQQQARWVAAMNPQLCCELFWI
jgi:hypothetical protein